MTQTVEMVTAELADPAATAAAGQRLAGLLSTPSDRRFVIFLRGDLGAGKTTFSRGFLASMGHQGRVPSPTYTLIEPYELSPRPVYHMDLYRLQDGAELEFLGLEDLPGNAVFLIEWPERAETELGDPDLLLELSIPDQGRGLKLQAFTETGAKVLSLFDF